jgi:cytoplasmic iron level regulating protein YaaA (DUF328/UPF0246 family)
VLLLLPPSEGKTPPGGAPLEFDELVYAKQLGRVRGKVLAALPGGRRLRAAPAGPAAEVYTGVLFVRLGLTALPAQAMRRAEEDLLITSGLWGLLRPGDRIPHYKLPAGQSLPRLGAGIAATWRPAIGKALAGRDVADELVIDLRSGPYVALWRPRSAQHLMVRVFQLNADGSRQVVSHMAKSARGDIAGAVLRARGGVRTPQDVAAIASAAGMRVELSDGEQPCLDVLQ